MDYKRFEINKSLLNIESRKGEKEDTMETISVSDGGQYHFWIYQKRNFLAYDSYSPETYIKAEYPGFEERKKLVDLMSDIELLMEKY